MPKVARNYSTINDGYGAIAAMNLLSEVAEECVVPGSL